jgi:hypothetical protein
MQTVTLDYALDVLESLPLEQQETLFEVWQQRKLAYKVKLTLTDLEKSNEDWREEVRLAALEAQEAVARGGLKPITIKEIMQVEVVPRPAYNDRHE